MQWRMSLSPPPGSLLATDCSKAVVLVLFLLNVFGVGVSCRNWDGLRYFIVELTEPSINYFEHVNVIEDVEGGFQ